MDSLAGWITWNPVKRARELSVLHYVNLNILDLRCRKSCQKVRDKLNITRVQLEEIVEDFIVKDILSLNYTFDTAEVSVTDFGKKVLDVARSFL